MTYLYIFFAVVSLLLFFLWWMGRPLVYKNTTVHEFDRYLSWMEMAEEYDEIYLRHPDGLIVLRYNSQNSRSLYFDIKLTRQWADQNTLRRLEECLSDHTCKKSSFSRLHSDRYIRLRLKVNANSILPEITHIVTQLIACLSLPAASTFDVWARGDFTSIRYLESLLEKSHTVPDGRVTRFFRTRLRKLIEQKKKRKKGKNTCKKFRKIVCKT